MNTENNQQTAQEMESRTEILCDVKRSETEIYRISRKDYKGQRFIDIRIFFRPKDDNGRLIPTHKGICFGEKFRKEVIAGLVSAQNEFEVEKPEGNGMNNLLVLEIPFSETEVLRISKGRGSKNAFVDIRRFYQKDSRYLPYKNKGIAIQQFSVGDVISGLSGMDISLPV